MVEVNVPLKQLHLGLLKTELIAAGIPNFAGELKPVLSTVDGVGDEPGTRMFRDLDFKKLFRPQPAL